MIGRLLRRLGLRRLAAEPVAPIPPAPPRLAPPPPPPPPIAQTPAVPPPRPPVRKTGVRFLMDDGTVVEAGPDPALERIVGELLPAEQARDSS